MLHQTTRAASSANRDENASVFVSAVLGSGSSERAGRIVKNKVDVTRRIICGKNVDSQLKELLGDFLDDVLAAE